MLNPAARPARVRVLIVYGTRPEAIKLAPVIAALRAREDRFESVVCTTGQQRELVAQVQDLLGLAPDIDLDVMTPGQSLSELGSRVMGHVGAVLADVVPEWVLVQGDTTTAMATALAAFQHRVRVGHVEAGLRTGNLRRPFPEEGNRRVIDAIADAMFAPTERARQALLREGCDPHHVFVTGNTIVDALRAMPTEVSAPGRDEVIVTLHRRESFGEPLNAMLAAVRTLAHRFPTIGWVVPVHPNPAVAEPTRVVLGRLRNVELCPPLDYREMVRRLRSARLVLTDSGGLQEEAPAFGVPVLVLREETERTEGIDAGVARLVGRDSAAIVAAASTLLADAAQHGAMATAANPYGDGRASERIAAILGGEAYEPFA